jgi:3-dehydroquinate dehydratase/shikimate dehydrogenase
MTHLCVSITVEDAAQAQRDLALAAERGADLAELRVDTFTDAEAIKRLLQNSPLPTIVTCRSVDEGGRSTLDDLHRLSLLIEAGAAGASYLDVEYAAVVEQGWAGPTKPRSGRPGWIYSSHDFVSRPPQLNQLRIDLANSACDVMKIAWNARSVRDNFEAFEMMRQRQKPTVVICMGEAGLISRVLAKKFGAFLSFASLDDASGTAPGQVTIEQMKRLYRWDAIGENTRVYGVVGQPIAHTMSPAIHNAAFDATGFDGVYVPLLVEASYEAFKAFMEDALACPGLMLSGLSVTIPHKENALRYLLEKGWPVEPLAERIGAVNTIDIDASNGALSCSGRNTDYAAILDAVTSVQGGTRDDLKGVPVAVLGAGGTGRTAAAALAAFGARVTIYNRTLHRAEALAAELSTVGIAVLAKPLAALAEESADVFVNTTSVGMSPRTDASPFDAGMPAIGPRSLVFDTVYNPPETKLLRQATAAGAKTIGGIEMFVRQAAAQFEGWTQLPAPSEVMRAAVVERLSK